MHAPIVRADVVATSNVSIATGLSAGNTIDGQTLVGGWVVLLTAQTAPAENGLYDVPLVGRAPRLDGYRTEYNALAGLLIRVMRGTTYADTLWSIASDPGGTLGATAITIDRNIETGIGGPASSVNDDIVIFDGPTGNLLKDSGSTVADVLSRANHTGTQTLSTISDAGTAAAADTGDFATSAQGALADTALQPADIGVSVAGQAALAGKVDVADSQVQFGAFKTVAGLLADMALTYSLLSEGARISAAQFPYDVAAAGASDHHLTTAGGLKLYARGDTRRITYTSQLGWTENTNAATQLATYISGMTSSDTLVVDGNYHLSGSGYQLPDGASIISANYWGQHGEAATLGFKMLDGTQETATANGLPLNNNAVFLAGNNCLFAGLAFTQDTIDPSGIAGGGNKSAAIVANTKSSVTVVGCKFDLMAWRQLYCVDSPDFRVENCYFKDGKYNFYLAEDSPRCVYVGCRSFGGYTARNLADTSNQEYGDGIKTFASLGVAPSRLLVLNSIFKDQNRDGIDTTAGIPQAIIANCVFDSCATGSMDVKTAYDSAGDLSATIGNKEIQVIGCKMIDCGQVFTSTWNYSPTAADEYDHCTQHIYHVGCQFIATGAAPSGNVIAFFIKGSHDIHAEACEFIDVNPVKTQTEDTFKPRNISVKNSVLIIGDTYTTLGWVAENMEMHFKRVYVPARAASLIIFSVGVGTLDFDLACDDVENIGTTVGEVVLLRVQGGQDFRVHRTKVRNASGVFDVVNCQHTGSNINLQITDIDARGVTDVLDVDAATSGIFIGNISAKDITALVTQAVAGTDIKYGGYLNIYGTVNGASNYYPVGFNTFQTLLPFEGNELTIASGVVTATHRMHAVDTQSDASTDDLDTINGGAPGDWLSIHAANGARSVVAKNGTGNLVLGADRTLNNANDLLVLEKRQDGNWYEVQFSDLGA